MENKIVNESQLQAALWKWAWNEYPQFRRLMWAVPNGQQRTVFERNIAKATGLLSGVWDLHCFYQGQYSIIETKFGNNQLSVDKNGRYGQKEWGELMAAHGARCYVYRGLEDGKRIYRTIFGV